MSCKWFRELYNKYCCPCLQNNQPPNTLPRLPRDIAETLADVNISTAPTPVNNDAIINDVVINDSSKNTYGTEPAHSVHSRKIEFSIDCMIICVIFSKVNGFPLDILIFILPFASNSHIISYFSPACSVII